MTAPAGAAKRKVGKWNPAHHPRDARGRFTRSATRVLKSTDARKARAAVTGFRPADIPAGPGGAREYLARAGAGAAHPDAVAEYFAGGWKTTNPTLRAGKTDDTVTGLDQAMKPLPDDVMLERRIPLKQFAHIPMGDLVGMKVRDAAPQSTMLQGAAGDAPDGMVTLHMATPAGTRAIINPDDGEILLDRDTETAISRAEPDGRGGWDLYGVVIPKTTAGKSADNQAGGDQGGTAGPDGVPAAAAGAPDKPADKPADKTPDTSTAGTATPAPAKKAAPAAGNGDDGKTTQVVGADGKATGDRISRDDAAAVMHGTKGAAAKKAAAPAQRKPAGDQVDHRPAGENDDVAGAQARAETPPAPEPTPELAVFGPLDQARIRNAAEDYASLYAWSPLIGASPSTVARYVAETGPALGEVTSRTSLSETAAAVRSVLEGNPEIMKRTPEQVEAGKVARAEAAAAVNIKAGELFTAGDIPGTMAAIDGGERIDPDYRHSVGNGPSLTWDDLRDIVRENSAEQVPAAGTSAPETPPAAAPSVPDVAPLDAGEERAAVAGRTFARTEGMTVDDGETRFRMRKARVGARIVDVHNEQGDKIGTAAEDRDGWSLTGADGSDQGRAPAFTNAVAVLDGAAGGDQGAAPDLDTRITDAVNKLAERPRELVSLARLRDELPDVDRAELDTALLRMDRSGAIQLDADPHRIALTDRAKAAAIPLGGEDMHLVSIWPKTDTAAAAPTAEQLSAEVAKPERVKLEDGKHAGEFLYFGDGTKPKVTGVAVTATQSGKPNARGRGGHLTLRGDDHGNDTLIRQDLGNRVWMAPMPAAAAGEAPSTAGTSAPAGRTDGLPAWAPKDDGTFYPDGTPADQGAQAGPSLDKAQLDAVMWSLAVGEGRLPAGKRVRQQMVKLGYATDEGHLTPDGYAAARRSAPQRYHGNTVENPTGGRIEGGPVPLAPNQVQPAPVRTDGKLSAPIWTGDDQPGVILPAAPADNTGPVPTIDPDIAAKIDGLGLVISKGMTGAPPEAKADIRRAARPIDTPFGSVDDDLTVRTPDGKVIGRLAGGVYADQQPKGADRGWMYVDTGQRIVAVWKPGSRPERLKAADDQAGDGWKVKEWRGKWTIQTGDQGRSLGGDYQSQRDALADLTEIRARRADSAGRGEMFDTVSAGDLAKWDVYTPRGDGAEVRTVTAVKPVGKAGSVAVYWRDDNGRERFTLHTAGQPAYRLKNTGPAPADVDEQGRPVGDDGTAIPFETSPSDYGTGVVHTYAGPETAPKVVDTVTIGGQPVHIVQYATVQQDRIDAAPRFGHSDKFYAVPGGVDFGSMSVRFETEDTRNRKAGDVVFAGPNRAGPVGNVELASGNSASQVLKAAQAKLEREASWEAYAGDASKNVGVHDPADFAALDGTAAIKPGDLVVIHSHQKYRTAVVTRVTKTKVEAIAATPSNPLAPNGATGTIGKDVKLLRARDVPAPAAQDVVRDPAQPKPGGQVRAAAPSPTVAEGGTLRGLMAAIEHDGGQMSGGLYQRQAQRAGWADPDGRVTPDGRDAAIAGMGRDPIWRSAGNREQVASTLRAYDPDAPAAGTSAPDVAPAPAVPAGPAPIPAGVINDQPLSPNGWDGGNLASPVYYHDDGEIGRAVKALGADARLDVDGLPLAEQLGRIATGNVRGDITAQEQLDQLKTLRDRLPDGPGKRVVSLAVDALDAPQSDPPAVPESTPAPLRQLMTDLWAIPTVRGDQRETNSLAGVLEQFDAGKLSANRLIDGVRQATLNNRHESVEGKAEVDRQVRAALGALEALKKTDREALTRDGSLTRNRAAAAPSTPETRTAAVGDARRTAMFDAIGDAIARPGGRVETDPATTGALEDAGMVFMGRVTNRGLEQFHAERGDTATRAAARTETPPAPAVPSLPDVTPAPAAPALAPPPRPVMAEPNTDLFGRPVAAPKTAPPAATSLFDTPAAAPASTAGPTLPTVPAAAQQTDITGGSTDFVPQSRSTIGVSDRGNVGRDSAALVQQLGMFDTSDQQQMQGQTALLDSLMQMPADAPPAAVMPVLPAAAPEVTPQVPDDLSGWSDEQLSGLFAELNNAADGDVDEPGMARILGEWETREAAMNAVVAKVPDDLNTLSESAAMGLYAELTSVDGSIHQDVVDRVGAHLDELDRRHVAELANLEAKRTLANQDPAEHADDNALTAALFAAADIGDDDAHDRILAEIDRREQNERDAAAATQVAEQNAAVQVQRQAAEAAQVKTAEVAQAAAVQEREQREAGLSVLDELLGEDFEARARSNADAGALADLGDQAANAQMHADLAAGMTPEQVAAKREFEHLDHDANLMSIVVNNKFSGDAERMRYARSASIEYNRRKSIALAQQKNADDARERRRLLTSDAVDLTDTELQDFPALLDALPAGEVRDRVRATRAPLVLAEANRRQAAADAKATRRAAGPSGPLRSPLVMTNYDMVEGWLNPRYDHSPPSEGSRRRGPWERWAEAKRVVVGLPSDSDDKALRKAEREDPRPVVDRAALALAWYRHLTEVDAPDTLDDSDVTLRGWTDDPDMPDTVDPLPAANIANADTVWEGLQKQAIGDRTAGDMSGVDRYYLAGARAYRIPYDSELSGVDLQKAIGPAVSRAMGADPGTDKAKAARLVAEWRRLAREAKVDPSDSTRYGPADRGGAKPNAGGRGTWRESTPAQEAEIAAMVAGGREWLDAYAWVHNLDVSALRKEEADSATRSGSLGTGGNTLKAYKQHYEEQVHSAWLAAETGTSGHLLNEAGKRAKIDPVSLFSGPNNRAMKYASEELLRWWASTPPPRMTFAEFKAQVAGGSASATSARLNAGKGNEFA